MRDDTAEDGSTQGHLCFKVSLLEQSIFAWYKVLALLKNLHTRTMSRNVYVVLDSESKLIGTFATLDLAFRHFENMDAILTFGDGSFCVEWRRTMVTSDAIQVETGRARIYPSMVREA